MPNPYVKQYLMTAGPTPVPPAVSQAMAAPMLYHRAPAFVEVYERVLAKLPKVFQTANDVLTFAASGSGAMDSAAANLVRPSQTVLACAAGKFGERWIELADAYGARTVRYEPGWGRRLDPAEIDRLLEQGGGAIVNTASVAGLIGLRGSASYVAAKHGVVGLTRTAALEQAQNNIRVNCVCPGLVRTPLVGRGIARMPGREAMLLANEPVGRYAEPPEIAEAVVWLCSEAASFVTGHPMVVDGGWVAQ